jgi:hypothetical protein
MTTPHPSPDSRCFTPGSRVCVRKREIYADVDKMDRVDAAARCLVRSGVRGIAGLRDGVDEVGGRDETVRSGRRSGLMVWYGKVWDDKLDDLMTRSK